MRPEKIGKWENKDINRKKLADRIMKRLTSAEKLTLDNQSVMIKYVKYKNNAKGMKGTSTIMNTDNYCFLYALFLGYLYHTNEKDFKKASQIFRKQNTPIFFRMFTAKHARTQDSLCRLK